MAAAASEPRSALRRAPPSRRAGLLLWGGIAASIVLGTIGSILTPSLSTRHPLLLLWIEAADRNLLLSRHVSLVPYIIAASVRRLASDPLFYLAGHWYGPAAMRRLEPHLGRRSVGVIERLFARAQYPMLIAFTGRTVSALAGVAGMPVVPFAMIAVVRTVAVVLLFRWLGNIFASPVDHLLRFFGTYLWQTSLVVLVVVLGLLFNAHRRERSSAARSSAAPSTAAPSTETHD